MQFLCCADLHIRANAPINRKDESYFDTVFGKFNQIIYLANKHNANIICAGDIFDNIRVSHRVVNATIDSLNRLEKSFLMVMGQHDLPNHKTDVIDSSPIQTILYLPNVELLGSSPKKCEDWQIFGSSWEQEIPKIKSTKKTILAIHKSITPEEPPFFLTEAISAEHMLESSPFQIIVSGDYHESFVHYKNGKVLINCGSMMRQKINEQYNHPCCYLIDTESKKISLIKLDIQNPDEVFLTVDNSDKLDQKFTEELSRLVESLKKRADKPNYKQIVDVIIKEVKPSRKTIEKIKELITHADR